MSEIAKLIDHVAAEALSAPLKAAGYRRAGRIWRCNVDGAIQVLNVQASRHNRGPDGDFCLNTGVYFPALATRIPIFPATEAPAEHDCHVRRRLTPAGKSWWRVRATGIAVPEPEAGRFLGAIFSWLDRRADTGAPETNARVTREIRGALEREAFPWIERMTDLRAARDELVRQGDLWPASGASLELGELGPAGQYFQEALAKAPAGNSDLLRWGRANGLAP